MHPYAPYITAALVAVLIAAASVTFAAVVHAAEKVDLILKRKRSEHLDQITKATQRLQVVREANQHRTIPRQRTNQEGDAS